MLMVSIFIEQRVRTVHVVMLMVFIEHAPHYSIHEVMVSIFIERSMPVS